MGRLIVGRGSITVVGTVIVMLIDEELDEPEVVAVVSDVVAAVVPVVSLVELVVGAVVVEEEVPLVTGVARLAVDARTASVVAGR